MAAAAPPGNLIEVLARTLTEFMTINDQLVSPDPDSREPCCFETFHAPRIHIRDYLHRMERYTHASEECYLSALILIDRLIHRHPRIRVTSYNVHRLVLVAVMAAAKYRDDVYYSNAYYAAVGGISLAELNYMERELLRMLELDCGVSFEDYLTYLAEIDTRYGPITGQSATYMAWAAAQQAPGGEPAAADGDVDMQVDMSDGSGRSVGEEGGDARMT
eukprot:TRINITY_DN12003_c0_g1_i1.p1 TRINITY_DN12003_c0_g1~~TRINITY_DN12003_c0_g1_i1.p1  ORF type:complete len:246 (+),score=65.21 TRINITY_DN12003_c0_g1_i1:86-739(+)